MKITYHFPTEQFGYTEVETDETSGMSYNHAKSLYGPPSPSDDPYKSLCSKEFNPVLDKYLKTSSMTSAEYQSLDPLQKAMVQCLKRAFARLKNNEDEQ